jgi:hypothetical protein
MPSKNTKKNYRIFVIGTGLRRKNSADSRLGFQGKAICAASALRRKTIKAELASTNSVEFLASGSKNWITWEEFGPNDHVRFWRKTAKAHAQSNSALTFVGLTTSSSPDPDAT